MKPALIEDLVVRTAPDLRTLVEQLNGDPPQSAICRQQARASTPQSKPASWPILPQGLASKRPGPGGSRRPSPAAGGSPRLRQTRLAHQLPRCCRLEPEEALSITRIHSVAGQTAWHRSTQQQRPFRAPHHSCSAAALLGGGHNPRPGEVSLAHGGVLFLDELAEFPRAVLDQLRQPLEEGARRSAAPRQSTVFPALVTLVAATNPAPVAGTAIVTMAAAAATANGSATGNASPVRCWIDWICSCDWNGAARPPSAAPEPRRKQQRPLDPPAPIERARQMIQRNPHRVCNGISASATGPSRTGAIERGCSSGSRLINQRGLSTRSGIRLLRVARTVAISTTGASVDRNAVGGSQWLPLCRFAAARKRNLIRNRAPACREHPGTAASRSEGVPDDGQLNEPRAWVIASPNQWNK